MSGNNIVPTIIDYVHEKIERCIQKYMSLEQTMTDLYDHYQIRQNITIAIWKHLERESPNFFKVYHKRCELARHIDKLNDLLSQQMYLMNKLTDPTTTSATATEPPDDSISSLINDPSPFAATRHSDPFTSFAATPQSDPPTTTGLLYDIDCDDSSFEKIAKDLEEQQKRMQLKVQINNTVEWINTE
ncbi:PREDICTED: uncharacterized protein LOC109129957 [Camelina sativa]|uniref:Uncharacterized protein LOC109129957 n=1 Tax=Camelina sativa TaxID=90675 RepID=A0ABM1R6C2_CAMSA|nr:PREDICTED: uncharacterized protein LOC109129957 [Camelina sativa]